MKHASLACIVAACVLATGSGQATETENLGIQVLPAPGKVVVDGKADDWDLSGGVFACGDAENLRDKLACWFHLMYDADNLYLLARWVDETPMNNPGSSRGDYGFAGDCLQTRLVTAPGDRDKERTTHVTAWLDRDGIDVVDLAYGKKFNEGGMKDAQAQGAVQVFAKNADGKGYVQEISIPWKLLCKDAGQGRPAHIPKAGDEIGVTLEPNFCTEARFRITIKDIFKAGVVPDRVFTFMSSQCWGTGTLEAKGNVPPRKLRLADGREFKTAMEKGLPVVDWTGLIRTKELQGFETIAFTMPEDGYISLNIRDKDGLVVRQLLNAEFRTRGKHTVKWDGLTTPNWRQPGQPVAPATYTWDALWHKGIGLRLVGWACNGGSAPWDGPSGKTNWGGDHGLPYACDADKEKVYLGWSGAEAGKALVACDLAGNVQWRLSRGGMSGAEMVTVDGGTVYAMNWDGRLFRADAKTGGFTDWAGSGSTDLDVRPLVGVKLDEKERANCLHARDGKVYVGFTKRDAVLVLDGKTGKLLKKLAVPAPVDIEAAGDKLFVISGWKAALAVNPQSGEAKPFVEGLESAHAIALDPKGNVYVGVRDPDNQVLVYGSDGKLLKTIGRKGGRALLGPWQPDGLRFVNALTVDAKGQLWAMEADDKPKRVSVWNTETGQLVREFFGPTAYGALGGAINPLDPCVMVGHSCEWRIDPKTGRDTCLGTITRDGVSNARFAIGANRRLYLALAANWMGNVGPLKIYERLGDADYRLRTVVYYADKDGAEIPLTAHGKKADAAMTMVWADANGDGERQPDELSGAPGEMRFSGWYMSVTPDLTLYSGDAQFRVAGFTACGAPRYDLAKPTKMPLAGLGSADGTLVLKGGDYGVDMSWFQCADIAKGKVTWRYPDNFVGVHGSHRAVPPEVGMIRGSYGPCGAAKLPEPIGNVWVIATNVGEWHLLTGEGYYLTRLFQGDPMKMAFPDQAVPGAILDNVPPGMGGEDFGGSIAATPDGQLYLQAGKTGFWNIKVVGLDAVKRLEADRRGGVLGLLGRKDDRRIAITEKEVAQARVLREKYLQEAVGTRRLTVKKLTPTFTGDVGRDFKDAQIISYKKQDDAAVRTAAAWDDANLYLAWDVKDATPWVNGAEAPEFLYAGGDTVDFQLGTDPKADPKRGEAALGDLRLSIGPFKGAPTAVLFRPKSAEKTPKKFYSGVVRDGYTVESVTVLPVGGASVPRVQITVTVHRDKKGYAVEAAIPLAALGIKPTDGLVLRGDFGVTHGDAAGKDTVLRTHWSNQATGIVNDEVFELKLEPRNWGELIFKP
ncbi:MAG TPA: PQQ-binding-like beta-propeller repeat protein [Planctomycetota bacterium]|nr:PQQ-binding-like beta-propeller repeat protein [Planctomycetota bacterium]